MARGFKTSPEDIAEIRRLRSQGLSFGTIASMLGQTKTSCFRHGKDCYSAPRRINKLTELEERIRSLEEQVKILKDVLESIHEEQNSTL